MPDLLTHVVLAYASCQIMVARGWIDRRHVPIGMGGAAIPDLAKLYLVVDLDSISASIGVPLTWQALHTLGAALLVALGVAVLFEEVERRTVFGLLAGGSMIHLFLDSFVKRADGFVPPYLYPVSWYQPPSGNLLLSSDLWPSLVAVGIAVLVVGWLRMDPFASRRVGPVEPDHSDRRAD